MIMVITEAVHRLPGIHLTTEENPGKAQLGGSSDKYCAASHLKWGSLPPNNVGRIVQHVAEGERSKEGNGEK